MIRSLLGLLLTASVCTSAVAAGEERIVSIGGAVTETVYALGAGDQVVASDTTSYYPDAAATLPKVGYMRALSAEGILSMQPTLVLLLEGSGPPQALQQLEASGVELLTLDAPRDIAGVKRMIGAVAARLDRVRESETLIGQIDRDTMALRERVLNEPVDRSVLFVLNHGGGSPMVAGHGTAADGIIALAGGRNAVDGFEGYKPLTPEAAVSLKPDVVLITDQGLEATGGEKGVWQVPGLSLTPAAENRRLIAMDALYLLGFGPRTAEAAWQLHDQLTQP